VPLLLPDPEAEGAGEREEKKNKDDILSGMTGNLTSSENGKVNNDQNQQNDVEADPV
jgi:hypothetical protein